MAARARVYKMGTMAKGMVHLARVESIQTVDMTGPWRWHGGRDGRGRGRSYSGIENCSSAFSAGLFL